MTDKASEPLYTPRVALVTGASGFIGSHVVRILLDQGVKVRALVQQGVPLQNLDGLDVEQIPGDLLDGDSLAAAVQGCDTLFHMAAIFDFWLPDPTLMYRVNVEGTVRLLRAAQAAGVERVIYTSSVASIGTLPGDEVADETVPFNNWAVADDYVLSKYIAEGEAIRFNLHGLPVISVCPCFPFGAGDIAPTPTGLLIQRYVDGENPFVFRGGFNAVNVKDVAWGHWLAAQRGRPGEKYILGGQNVTYREFADLTCKIAEVKAPKWEVNGDFFALMGRVNEWFARLTGIKPYVVEKGVKFIAGRHIFCDVGKARRELGYEPRPLEEGITEAVEWFKEGRDRALGELD